MRSGRQHVRHVNKGTGGATVDLVAVGAGLWLDLLVRIGLSGGFVHNDDMPERMFSIHGRDGGEVVGRWVGRGKVIRPTEGVREWA